MTFKLKYFLPVFIFSIFGTISHTQELALRAATAFANKAHTFATISRYAGVQAKVHNLLEKQKQVIVCSDWDDTITSPGAWHQKFNDGKWVCPTSKRMLLENEVDSHLREPEISDIITDWRNQNIPVLITTARPPIIDTKLTKYAKQHNLHPNLMDARLPDNPEQIDYDTIQGHISTILKHLDSDILLEKTAKKIDRMSQQSRIDLRGQKDLQQSTVIKNYDGHILTYHDSYAFIGHNKGPNFLRLIQDIELPQGDLVIVDDSPKAIGSYLNPHVITGFEEAGYTLHLMYYPSTKLP